MPASKIIRGKLTGQAEVFVVLVDDQEPPGLADRLANRVRVERHDAAQIDHPRVDTVFR